MNFEDLLALVALGVAVLLVLLVTTVALLRVVRRDRARTAQALAEARAEAADLRQRLDALSHRLEAPPRPAEEFVITDIGTPEAEPLPSPPTRIEGRLFVDIVLRESVVKAASLGYGVRRALAPESRNRIRFEMKREVKRSRRQRRAELKEMRRRHQARQREQEVA
ncbi:MAG: hypothetical protein ABWX84_13255 [Nocardioides sp.]